MRRQGFLALAIGLLTVSGSYSAWGYEAVKVKNGGTVTGTIRFEGQAPAPIKLPVTKNQNVCGPEPHTFYQVAVSPKGGLANVWVSLIDIQKGKALPKKGSTILQKKCWFEPRITLVPLGVRFTLVNDDKILHNFRTLSRKNTSLNIAHPKFKKNLSVKKTFSKPELMKIACDIHNWMTGWLVAVDHPYNVVSGQDGTFTLKDVPPGSYKLQAWHEKLGTQVQTITVPAGGEAKVAVAFKK